MTTNTIGRRHECVLVAFTDGETGERGLGLEDMRRNADTNAATEGLLIAHDILEHVNGPRSIGTIEDELEALGAIWYVRGQFHDLRRDSIGSMYSTHENVASDIVRMFRDWFYGATFKADARRTRPCDHDADLREVIECAARSVRGELDGDEDPREVARMTRQYLRACLPLMRIGYRKAARRFKGNASRANSLFWDIAEAAGKACKQVDYEGQKWRLVYGIRDGETYAYVEEFYED